MRNSDFTYSVNFQVRQESLYLCVRFSANDFTSQLIPHRKMEITSVFLDYRGEKMESSRTIHEHHKPLGGYFPPVSAVSEEAGCTDLAGRRDWVGLEKFLLPPSSLCTGPQCVQTLMMLASNRHYLMLSFSLSASLGEISLFHELLEGNVKAPDREWRPSTMGRVWMWLWFRSHWT